MKKYFSLYVAVAVIFGSIAGTSCKKRLHSGAPTPNNVRLKSYSKITSIKNTVPLAGAAATISENFRFVYDESGRISRIIYSGNDSFEIHKNIDFTYKGDTILKVITNILGNAVVERDTFVKYASNGMIRCAYTPFQFDSFDYYGKLMARHQRIGHTYRNTKLTTVSTYTSVDGDFLRNYYDGEMKLEFNDMKIGLFIDLTIDPIPATVTINRQQLDYTLQGYNYNPIYIYVKDTNNKKDSLQFNGKHWVNESYHFYTNDANRVGDYLWLESMTFYSQNIYENKHLVESITSRNYNSYIKYKIDATNKITQAEVVETDSLLNEQKYVYDLQYETY